MRPEKPMAGRRAERKAAKPAAVAPDRFKPLTHDDVAGMLARIKFGLTTTGARTLEGELLHQPDPEWIAEQTAMHAEEEHDEIDGIVRKQLELRENEEVRPGVIARYKELYEEELERRHRKGH